MRNTVCIDRMLANVTEEAILAHRYVALSLEFKESKVGGKKLSLPKSVNSLAGSRTPLSRAHSSNDRRVY